MTGDTHDDTEDESDDEGLPDWPFLDADRKRGILTKADRELILGEREFETEQQERDARYRMRQRLKAAILDINLLTKWAVYDEYRAVFDSLQTEYADRQGHTAQLMQGPMSLAVQIAYALFEREDSPQGFSDNIPISRHFESELHSAILHSEKRLSRDPMVTEVSVNVEINREPFAEQEVFFELVYGEPTQEQFFYYLQHGDLEELQQALEDNDTEIVYEYGDGEYARIGPDDPILQRRL